MSDRKVQISHSDDGGYNYSNIRYESMGEKGEYGKRIRIRRYGSFRQRCIKIVVSSDCKRDMIGAVAQFEGTTG